MSTQRRATLRIQGTVQGVSFRESSRAEALRLGLLHYHGHGVRESDAQAVQCDGVDASPPHRRRGGRAGSMMREAVRVVDRVGRAQVLPHAEHRVAHEVHERQRGEP